MKKTAPIIVILLSVQQSVFPFSVERDPEIARSILIEGFNGTNDPSTARARVEHTLTSGGTALYTYTNHTPIEGYIVYIPAARAFIPAFYTNIRARFYRAKSSGGNAVQLFPSPIQPGNFNTIQVAPSSNFNERIFSLGNLNVNGTGLRIDPFNYANDGTNDRFEIDYFFADLGRVVGFEFDREGDELGLSDNFPDWGVGPVVSNGVLTGQAAPGGGANSDVQFSFNPYFAKINPDIYKYVEIRMRGYPGDRIDFFYSTGITGGPPIRYEIDPASDGTMHTYLLDLTDEAAWTGTVDFLRIDPSVSGDATFEIDYFRFLEKRVGQTNSLAVFKRASTGNLVSGSNLSYTITVTNYSYEPKSGIVATDALPGEVLFVSSVPPATETNGNFLGFDLGTLPGRGAATITIDATVTSRAPGIVSNAVFVSTTNTDTTLSDNRSFALTTLPDLDGDGVNNTFDPDIDGDGFPNDHETIAGTDALDPASFLRLGVFRTGMPHVQGLRFFSVTGRTYSIETGTNILNGIWTLWTNNLPGNDGPMVLNHTHNVIQLFYRLGAETP